MDTNGKRNQVQGEGIEIEEEPEWNPEEWVIWCNRNRLTLKIKGNGKEKSNRRGSEGSCR